MENMFDIESASHVPATTTTMVEIPEDAHIIVKKIVSLLAQALVLSLGLLKGMVKTRDTSHSRHIEDQGQRRGLVIGQELSARIETAHDRRASAEQASIPGVSGTGFITFERGQSAWSGYTGIHGEETTVDEDIIRTPL